MNYKQRPVAVENLSLLSDDDERLPERWHYSTVSSCEKISEIFRLDGTNLSTASFAGDSDPIVETASSKQ
jgi:hypothetical protein